MATTILVYKLRFIDDYDKYHNADMRNEDGNKKHVVLLLDFYQKISSISVW